LEYLEMKKSLVALAALAATSAFAQSSVSITGLVDIGYRSVNAPAGGDTKGAFQNGSATTTLNFIGTEDLGGGLKADFRIELNPDLVNGAGLTGNVLEGDATTGATPQVRTSSGGFHQTFVGLSGGFGSVKFGRLNSASLGAWGTGSVFGTALGSGYGSNGNIFTRYSSSVANFNQTAPTRFNGAVEFTSPSFNGVTARALFVPKVDNSEAGSTNNATVSTIPGVNRAGVTDFGLAYNQGPLNIAVAQQQHSYGANTVNGLVTPGSNAALNDKYKLTTMAANYTIGAATFYAANWTEKATATTTTYTAGYDIKGNMFGAKYVMGAVTVMASMGKSNDATSVNIDRSVTGLGADYALSKRTNLWARYENRDANKNSVTDDASNGSTKTMAAGVRHTF
jgi:predicted porin